jgi:hypothetical protein
MSEPAPGSPRGSSARPFAALMKKNPALRGVVFDRAHILPSALQAAEDLGLHGRFRSGRGFLHIGAAG